MILLRNLRILLTMVIYLVSIQTTLYSCLAAVHVFYLKSCRSFSTVVRKFIFGRPTFPFPSGVHVKAVSSLTWFYLGYLYLTHHVAIYLSKVLLRHLNKIVSSLLLLLPHSFHISYPYNNTGLTSVLYTVSLVVMCFYLSSIFGWTSWKMSLFFKLCW